MATLSVTSTTDSSIRVKLSGLDSSYSGDRYYYWYIDGEYDGESSSSGSTTSKSYTFSGLEPDTEYYIQCSLQWWTDDGNGDEQWSRFSVYGTTDPYEYECYYYVTNITTNSITIAVYGLESGFTVRYYVIDNETEEYVVDKAYTATSATLTKTFSGLTPGTEYRINVEIDNSYQCGVEYHTTLLPDYSFEVLLPTADTVGAVIYEVLSGDTVRIYIREGSASASTGTVVHDKLYTADSEPFTVEGISGLLPGTKYTMNVSINGGDWLGGQEFTTGSSRPDDWEWWSTVAKGAEIQLSAAEWNAFGECINEFRVYAGLSEYSFTTAVSGTTKISAAIVNQARTAISAIDGHGTLPSAAVAGNPITAAFFNNLKDALNAIA